MTANTIVGDRLIAPVHSAVDLTAEFLTSDEFARILRVSKRTLFRLRARGDLPIPVEIATNIVRWRSSDVRGYLASLKNRQPRRPRR